MGKILENITASNSHKVSSSMGRSISVPNAFADIFGYGLIDLTNSILIFYI